MMISTIYVKKMKKVNIEAYIDELCYYRNHLF